MNVHIFLISIVFLNTRKNNIKITLIGIMLGQFKDDLKNALVNVVVDNFVRKLIQR